MAIGPLIPAASGIITRRATQELASQLVAGGASASSAIGAVRTAYHLGKQAYSGVRQRRPRAVGGGGGRGRIPPTPPRNNNSMDIGPSHSSNYNTNNNNNPGHSMVRRLNNRRSSRRRLGSRRRQLARGVLRRRPNMSRINRVYRKASRRNSRNYKRSMKPIDHAKKGISQVTQSSGTIGGGAADSDRTVYLGHATCPSELTLFTSFLALGKKILLKAGFDVRGTEDFLPSGMTFTWGYYPNARTTTLTTFAATSAAFSSLNNVAAELYRLFSIAITNFPSMQPYELRLDFGSNIYYVHTDKCYIDISCKSILKIQNRTSNASGGSNVDVNNVNYIQGIRYVGSGTGSYFRDVRVATSAVNYQPFIAGRRTGFFARTDLPVGTGSLQTPPASKLHFSYVKDIDKIQKFMPGETKISILTWSKQMLYTKFITQYLQDINNNTYNLAQVGKFAFYGLTKYIDDDIVNKPQFAYEVEQHYGMTITKDINPITVQAYIPDITEGTLIP
jgi:hypothetical protein